MSSPIVIIRGADSGACGGWTVVGEKVSSRGSDSAFEGRTLVWPEELEASACATSVSDVSSG